MSHRSPRSTPFPTPTPGTHPPFTVPQPGLFRNALQLDSHRSQPAHTGFCHLGTRVLGSSMASELPSLKHWSHSSPSGRPTACVSITDSGHPGRFPVCAVVGKAAGNIRVQVSAGPAFSSPGGECRGARPLDHTARAWLVLAETTGPSRRGRTVPRSQQPRIPPASGAGRVLVSSPSSAACPRGHTMCGIFPRACSPCADAP